MAIAKALIKINILIRKEYHYGKKNQSFKLEDAQNRSLYEANLLNFRLFGACDYEFVEQSGFLPLAHVIEKQYNQQKKENTRS